MSAADEPHAETDLAVVGMAARFPGAANVREFWSNLLHGVESIRDLSEEELVSAGIGVGEYGSPQYVRRAAVLDAMDQFDAGFFGFSPQEAAILDPQHRVFLEICWWALEDAGVVPSRFDGSVGIFGGCGMAAYFARNLLTNPAVVEQHGEFLLRHTGNDKDFLCTRVSHLFDLRGPSINVQTACSTSLVAVHLAGQSLLAGECDLALAGGVTIEVPHGRGYLPREGEVLSPDGRCRPFDAAAQGTVFGSGAGVVVLRRLSDALAARDPVYAVVKGSAINNDGARKVGYLAPSVDGQTAAVAEALALAGVEGHSLGFLECHGTGTAMGDPIELQALTEALGHARAEGERCALGSVKANIGHLDTAAGVAGFIKAVLAVRDGRIPPQIHFANPNPAFEWKDSPFAVWPEGKQWRCSGPRRAGVNALGVGGTNAFVVLEEAPQAAASPKTPRKTQLLLTSAKDGASVRDGARQLAAALRTESPPTLPDVAHTLSEGREHFSMRAAVVAADAHEAANGWERVSSGGQRTIRASDHPTEVVFLFPGGGATHPGMAVTLWQQEPIFRAALERGIDVLGGLGFDAARLRRSFAGEADALTAGALRRPSLQLPVLLAVELALAETWREFGLRPAALLGHSVGEMAAACTAGVFLVRRHPAARRTARPLDGASSTRSDARGLRGSGALAETPTRGRDDLCLQRARGLRRLGSSGGAGITRSTVE